MWCSINHERPLGDRPAQGLHAGGNVIVRIDGLADVVQKRGQQKLFIVGLDVAGQVEYLEAMVERIPLGMIFRVLFNRFQRQQSHLVDGEPIEMIGERERRLRPLPVPAWRRPVRDRRPIRDEEKSVAREPRNRKEGPRPDAVAQDGSRLPLGHVQIIRAGQIEPARRRLVPRGNQRSVQSSRGLDRDLAPSRSDAAGTRYRLRYLSCMIVVPPAYSISPMAAR